MRHRGDNGINVTLSLVFNSVGWVDAYEHGLDAEMFGDRFG
jgi:hypothetical protein